MAVYSNQKPLFADQSKTVCPYVGCFASLVKEDGNYRCLKCQSSFYEDKRTIEESYNDE